METHFAYCARLDRDVRIYLRPVTYDETDPVAAEPPGLVCLEHGEECLGMQCPLFRTGPGSLARFERLFRR
jgi:hypothetical protein